MKAFITVIGRDRVGIIAAISTKLTQLGINIEDISQTIVQGNFTMVMAVVLPVDGLAFNEVAVSLKEIGTNLGLDITLQHMDIFEAMHRI